MTLLEILSREHELFLGILDRLERSLRYDEPTARAALRDACLLLLPALEKHEAIENAIFGGPARSENSPVRRLLAEVEVQHRKLDGLKAELKGVVSQAEEVPLARLKDLAFELGEKLRSHFRTEETRLWPHFQLTLRHGREAAVARRALSQVRALELSVERSRALLDQYLGARR